MEGTHLKFGLGVNVNETTAEIVKNSILAQKLELDYAWVADSPTQRHALTVASAIAVKTKKLRIGLGLLSLYLYTPEQIANGYSTLVEAYGDRFELCIGSGDRNQLQKVGVSFLRPEGISNYVLNSKETIAKKLIEKRIKGKVWLGAQGLKMLRASRFFNGVLLNYAASNSVKWALREIGVVSKRDFQLGVYAPSYVYRRFDKEVYSLLRNAAAVVALGASTSVLKRFGVYKQTVALREKLEAGCTLESVSNDVPAEIVDLFSICTPMKELSSYVSEMSRLGIEHIVFGYPQNFSDKTIKDLARALP